MARSHAAVEDRPVASTLEQVPVAPLTRRRALAIAAAAGLGSMLARTPTPTFARARSFGLSAQLNKTLRGPRRFDLVGLSGANLERAQLKFPCSVDPDRIGGVLAGAAVGTVIPAGMDRHPLCPLAVKCAGTNLQVRPLEVCAAQPD